MSASRRIRLGDWTCPSGNNVAAYYRAADGVGHLDLEWDSPPPLAPADAAAYLGVIRPAILARAREYTEQTGRTLVVTP